MSGICLAIGADPAARPASLSRMVAVAPYRGAVAARLDEKHFSCAVQAAPGQDVHAHIAHLTVFLSGYLTDTRAPLQSAGSSLAATQLAKGWLADGRNCLQHVDGAFSAVVWDERAQRLTLIVSAMGTAPLFSQTEQGGGNAVFVATEIRQVLAGSMASAKPNVSALAQHLCFSGTVLDPWATPYQRVERIPAGYLVSYDFAAAQTSTVECFWDLVAHPEAQHRSESELQAELIDLLRSSVMSSLQPDGAVLALSGGMDSSTIFALLREAVGEGNALADQVRTLSFIYPGYGSDEHAYIDQNHQHWGTVGCYRDISDVEIADFDTQWLEELEFPPTGMTAYHLLMLREDLHAAGYHNLIMGASGDLWMIIPQVFQADALRKGHWLKAVLPDLFPLVSYPGEQGSTLKRLAAHALFPPGSPVRRLLRKPVVPAWLGAPFRELLAERDGLLQGLCRDHGYARATMIYQWRAYWQASFTPLNVVQTLAGRGIQLLDPLGMRRVMEWVISSPLERLGGRGQKQFLREAMAGLVPDAVRLKYERTVHNASRERGYDPLRAQLKGDDWCLVDLGLLDPSYVRAVDWRSGDDRLLTKLEEIAALELFVRKRFT